MKKNIRVLLSMALVVILMAALFGCGKDEETQEKVEGEVYVPEYAQLAVEGDYISETVAAGDVAYFYTVSYDEETGQSENIIYKYDLLENKADKLPFEVEENSSAYDMAMDVDGNLVFIMNYYDESGDVTGGEDTIELRTISADDGSVINSQVITELLSGTENMYVQQFAIDAQGNIYLYDSESTIHVVNKDFQKVCDITTEGWINDIVKSKEGDIYISTYGETGLELRKVDIAGKKLGEAITGPGDEYGNSHYYTGLNSSLFVSNNDQVFSFDIQTGVSEKLFKWLDVDVNGDNIDTTGELSDGRIWAVTRDYNSEGEPSYELIFLTRKNASEVAAKEEIIFGTMWLDSDLRKNIIDFNKKSDQYRIKVKDYASEDYQTGLTQFNADMTTGNCPDIVDLSSLDFKQYASKGILEDMYPYMKKSGIKKEDYLENIFKAYEVDGKLYGIIPKFYVSTIMVKTALVGDVSGWTLSEMLDFAEDKNPENIFPYGNRSSIFYYCIYNNIDEFIDWETGKCTFDGEEFIRTLEFAARFPEEVDYNEDSEGIASRLHSDKVLLMQESLSSVQEYQMMNGLFGEKATYIGYPNHERKGNLIQPTSGSMAMTAKSKHKDGAWEFIKTVLSEEYQDSLIDEYGGFGFPVKKSSLDKQFELDMTPNYYEDENGNKVESPKTTWGYDDFEMEIMAATQEEIDAVRGLIESADKLSSNANEQLVNIITEESEPFFKGQKSAADTAGIIQNRIQIYVNENR